MPRHPDGSVDFEAFPERIFGPEHVVRHPDGSMNLVNVPEWKLRPEPRVLHRATCENLLDLGDQYQVICGTRDELNKTSWTRMIGSAQSASEPPRGQRLRPRVAHPRDGAQSASGRRAATAGRSG